LNADMTKWKDRSADGPVSAKKPRKVKERQQEEQNERTAKHSKTQSQEEDDPSKECV
jgi:hypothetical protein